MPFIWQVPFPWLEEEQAERSSAQRAAVIFFIRECLLDSNLCAFVGEDLVVRGARVDIDLVGCEVRGVERVERVGVELARVALREEEWF